MAERYQQNIFDVLSEDGSKKQKPKQQAVAPKQDKKGKAPAPAKSEPKKQQQGGRAQGGRGGRGRGGARGEGRGRGGDAPITADDRQGGNNNRGRQVSRRQRDEAFKRGDYGNPDQDRPQKRAYEKFSHSSASRRKQEKKGGHGAGNWGESGKDDVSEEKKEGEEETEKVEEVDQAGENGEDVEKEEDDNEIDMNEFIEKQKKESEELAKLVEVQDKRTVDNEFPDGMKPLSKEKEEQIFPIAGGKKNKKKAANQKDGKVSADKVLNLQAPRQDNNRRNNKGRQNNRPPQRGNKRNANLDLEKDFPSLG